MPAGREQRRMRRAGPPARAAPRVPPRGCRPRVAPCSPRAAPPGEYYVDRISAVIRRGCSYGSRLAATQTEDPRMRLDVHQHIWTAPLIEALAARATLPFVRV